MFPVSLLLDTLPENVGVHLNMDARVLGSFEAIYWIQDPNASLGQIVSCDVILMPQDWFNLTVFMRRHGFSLDFKRSAIFSDELQSAIEGCEALNHVPCFRL